MPRTVSSSTPTTPIRTRDQLTNYQALVASDLASEDGTEATIHYGNQNTSRFRIQSWLASISREPSLRSQEPDLEAQPSLENQESDDLEAQPTVKKTKKLDWRTGMGPLGC